MSELDELEDMEMPVPCQYCNEWFELNDGYGSKKWFPNTLICEPCSRIEEEEIKRDEEIEDFELMLSNALHELNVAERNLQRLKPLGFVPTEKLIAIEFYTWVCNQSIQGRTTEKLWLDYKAEQNAKV